MAIKASVVGASGYAGGELLRLLAGHPEIELAVAAAGANAGARITDVHPQLPTFSNHRFAATDPDELATLDLVFVALPHGESAALTDRLPSTMRVVDLGADHRLRDAAAWDRYYGVGAMAKPWTYGLPELPDRRELIKRSTQVASPGCYATAIELSLAPLLGGGYVEPDDVVIVAASGTSGAGRKGTVALSASEAGSSMSAYKVGGVHQHTAEIEQELSIAAGQPVAVSFTPMLAPMPRGILATTTARTRPGVTFDQVNNALRTAYSDERFVFVLPEGDWPKTASTFGSNAVHLQVAVDARAGRVIVVAAIDNLGKGAASQAVQNANLMLGFDEALGLTSIGVAP